MKLKIIFTAFFIFFISIQGIYSKGSADKDYSQAKSYLKARDSQSAIEQVLDVVEPKPETMEYGINITRKALSMQHKFQDKFDELMKLLYEDPENNTKKLALIYELENIQANIDDEMQFFLTHLEVSSLYAVYRVRFNLYMEEGIALIKEQEYVRASETFTKGYSIYNKEFQEIYEGTELQNSVNSELDNVKAAVQKYEKAYSNFFTNIKNYQRTASSESFNRADQELENIKNNLNELRSITESVVKSGRNLRKIYSAESKRNKKIDETIFPFAYRLTMGRDSAKEYEGVEGAMEAGIYNNLNSIVKMHWDEIRLFWDKFCNNFDFKNNFSPDKYISGIDLNLNALKKIYDAANTNSDSRFKQNIGPEAVKHSTINFLKENIKDTKNIYAKYLELKENENIVDSRYKGNIEDLRNLKNERLVKLNEGVAETKKLISDVEKYNRNIDFYKAMEYEKSALQGKQKQLLKKLQSMQFDFYNQLVVLKNLSGEKALVSLQKDYENCQKYLAKNNQDDDKQKKDKNENSEDGSLYTAVLQLREIKKHVEGDIKILEKFISEVNGIDKSLVLTESFSANKSGIENTVQMLKELDQKVGSDMASGNAALLKIKLAKNEADLRFEEAKRNLAASAFSAARKNLELSRLKTNAALALEDNAEYKKMTDERLEKLGKEINDAENIVVVKDVRRYLQEAKRDYFNSEFQYAEDKLIAAKNRWAVTNVSENEEVESWLTIVQSAGSIKTERTVPVSAPLYPQMMQLLNNASQLYSDAVKKINNGKRADAMQDLNQAKENIKSVLLVYPSNGTAGQLGLKIDKLIDPDNFSTQFVRRISGIRTGYRNNPRHAYNELLNLYGIDKNFPGIVSLKDEIEIYIGIKVPPPDYKAISESAELTKSAKQIYENRNSLSIASSASMSVAVEQLDKAIRLDPNNTEAITLKDAIQIYMGGSSTVVLSAEDEARYQQAVTELQNGNKIIASALIRQLLQKKSAGNSAKVLELKKRIDARL